MAAEQYANSAFSTLASSISSGDTSLTVATGHGARFPATGDFRLKIDNEILLATARSGDVITVTRAQEGTLAAAHTAPVAVNHVLTRGSLLALFGDPVFTGQALFPDGSVAAPSIANTGDLNTGVYWPADDTLGFSGGGVLAMTITDDLIAVPFAGSVVIGASIIGNHRVGIYDTDATSRVTLDVILNSTGTGTDAGAVRGVARQLTSTGGGDGAIRGGEFHAQRDTGSSSTWGIEVSASNASGPTGTYNGVVGAVIHGDNTDWGIGPDARGDTGLLVAGGNGWTNGIVVLDPSSVPYFRVPGFTTGNDVKGDVHAISRIYSTGVGGSRVGILDHTATPAGQTWGGMNYDNASSRLEIGVRDGLSTYQDVHIAPSGGMLRVGEDSYKVWRNGLIAVCNAQQTVSTTPADLSNCSVILDQKGHWLVTASAYAKWVGAGDNGQILGIQLVCTGGTSSFANTHGYAIGNAGDAQMIGQSWIVAVTGVSVTAKLQGLKGGGSGTSTIEANDTQISAVWMGNP